mgnify:CR=1 FL=1
MSCEVYSRNKEKGGFVVTLDGEVKKVSELSKTQVERMMAQDATLKKRAEEAQGFMTTLQNLFKSLKNLGMSFFSGLDSTLGPALRALTGTGEGTLASASEKFFQAGQDFGTFIKAVVKEPTMSKYLNNRQNSKQKPNENFARELLELFTLGNGNYTEQDIKETARA